ncbi:MAG: hypothetical protein ABJD07_15145, partial [Gemmatimonadaceae bacterium]
MMRAQQRVGTWAIAVVFAALGSGVLSAQGGGRDAKIIVGRVTDSASGAGLPGANVSVVGRAGGVVTSDVGSFLITSPSGA